MNVQSSVISASALVNELSSVHVLMRDDMMRIVGYSKKKKKKHARFHIAKYKQMQQDIGALREYPSC